MAARRRNATAARGRSDLPQPLFIICPGRSFSSVVCAAIGQHPQMFGLPEVNLFVKPMLADLVGMEIPVLGIPGAAAGLRRTIAELKFGTQTEETVNEANRWIEANGHLTGVEVFDLIREWSGGRVIVDKTPTNSQARALARVHAAYPDAYYLHLARHPRSSCRSRLAAYESRQRGGTDLHAVEALWFSRNSELIEFGQSLAAGQYMYLKGEMFFEEPQNFMRQICEWMGLDAAEAAIDAMMHPETSPFACYGPPNARMGNNKGFIESPALRVGKLREENLDDPLEWFKDETVHFAPATKLLAQVLGYDR